MLEADRDVIEEFPTIRSLIKSTLLQRERSIGFESFEKFEIRCVKVCCLILSIE